MENNKLKQFLDIGIALTAEKDPNRLLDIIVETAMNLTASDGGTLYILKDEKLYFRIMKTRSKGVDVGKNGEEISLPPVGLKKENICAYAAISKQSLNIPDVYASDLFDFSGPKRYDAMNNYRTQSMLTIPMINYEDKVIGVMQLLNATGEDGTVRPFTDDEEKILLSLSSQTAIALSNMAYIEEINKQMWSFTEAMTEAIDARTPYNASHTRNVAKYSGMLVDYINLLHERGEGELSFSKEHKDKIVMAAYLHDIGKMIVPIEVMNKQTRLEKSLEKIESRLENIGLRYQVDCLKGDISEADFAKHKAEIEKTLTLVRKADGAGFIDDETMAEIKSLFDFVYVSPDKETEIPFLTEEEKQCLQIRKGTLSDEERGIMESHALMTERILNKVYFNSAYKEAPIWAAQHHECINGTGYPKKIGSAQLGPEARILAVADICDALLATDRPYKKPLPKEKAFAIMMDMASMGKIEKKFVEYLEKII